MYTQETKIKNKTKKKTNKQTKNKPPKKTPHKPPKDNSRRENTTKDAEQFCSIRYASRPLQQEHESLL